MSHENQPINVEKINSQQAVQSPAEREYFKNLSNRIFIRAGGYGLVGAVVFGTLHGFDSTSMLTGGSGTGLGILLYQIWLIRGEKLPRKQK